MANISKKAALLIGINYTNDPINRLNGCCNDVMNMAALLQTKYGFTSENITVLADLEPALVALTTYDSIIQNIKELSEKSWKEDLDVAFFHYSGHGSQQTDFSGDEADGKDEGICPCDFAKRGLILDDELLKLFKTFNPKTTIFVVFDCCHSASMLDLPYVYPSLIPEKEVTVELPKIVMISGCIDASTSEDAYDTNTRRFGGALTMCLNKVFHDNQSTVLSSLYERLLNYIKAGEHRQHPIMSSSFPIDTQLKMF